MSRHLNWGKDKKRSQVARHNIIEQPIHPTHTAEQVGKILSEPKKAELRKYLEKMMKEYKMPTETALKEYKMTETAPKIFTQSISDQEINLSEYIVDANGVRRKRPTKRLSEEVIIPERAMKWLEGRIHPRALRQRKIEEMTQAMKESRFRANGESIIFDWNGVLQDGQHRLWACVESQRSFKSVIVYDADPADYPTIDQGSHRSPSDHITTSGLTKAGSDNKSLAAIAGLILRYRSDQVFSNVQILPQSLIDLVRDEPQIAEWGARAKKAPVGLKGFSSPIAAVCYLGSEGYPKEADLFLDRWVTGANLSVGSPILTLRNRVLTNAPHLLWERMYITSAAWNAFVQNRTMFKMGWMKADKFPRIIGSK